MTNDIEIRKKKYHFDKFNLKLYILIIIKYIWLIFKHLKYFLILEINGDWGLGIGDWGLGIGPNPQSPIPHPQFPSPFHYFRFFFFFFYN